MSKRKACNRKVQIERSMKSLLRTNHAAIVSIDPSGAQAMVQWKACKQILNRKVRDAICDLAHHWTVYIAGICTHQDGSEYIQGVQIKPAGIHRFESLRDVIEHFYTQVSADCNQNHRIGMAWLAVPYDTSITDAEAAAVFSAAGAWRQVKVAA